MENTQEQKTPEQWFQMLKEPYRSEAIAGINKRVRGFQKYPKSLESALYYSLYWDKVYAPTRNDWDIIHLSITRGETTYLEPEKEEPETLKPEQMESGKWYVVTITDSNNWLIKFDKNNLEYCYHQIGIFMPDGSIYNHIGALCLLIEIKSIRPATKEEVLKYFPDEVFEPIELRSEETTNWEAKYNELKAKYDQLEPKGEKVYFYFDKDNENIWTLCPTLQVALNMADENQVIYGAYCIGKKKSVLVNENS